MPSATFTSSDKWPIAPSPGRNLTCQWWSAIRASCRPPFVGVDASLPPALQCNLAMSHMFSLAPLAMRRVSYTLPCLRRGQDTLEQPIVQVVDVFGLERRTVALGARQHLTVYPRVVPLERLGLPTHSPAAVLPTRAGLFADPHRVVGVRPYHAGDSPRHIHWTATARTAELQVKRFHPAVARELSICLSLDSASYLISSHAAVEQAIVVAASAAHQVVTHERLPVGLATETGAASFSDGQRLTLPPRPGQAQLMQVLETLARVRLTMTTRFADLVQEEGANLAWGVTLLIVTGYLDRTLAEMVWQLRRRGRAITLVLVAPSEQWARYDGAPGLPGVPIHRVWNDHGIMEGL